MPEPISRPAALRDDHDALILLDEEAAAAAAPAGRPLWRVLIVDDDEDVHTATTYALGNLDMQQRPLQFLHAYSAAQARAVLAEETDIAVILLDVVMEQPDAGLHLVRHIRDTLQLTDVRIILRTGQPGYAPEIDAIRDYDINDYKTKSELTRVKLFTAVTAAIRSYQQLRAIGNSRRGLGQIVQASSALMALHGMDNFAAGVLTQAAELLAITADGILCLQDQAGALAVLAGAGSLGALAGSPLSAFEPALQDALHDALAQRRSSYGARSAILYFAGKGDRRGVAYLRLPQPLDELDERLLQVFCSNVAVGLDNVELLSHLHNAAFFDHLSKLPNRTRLIELLDDTLAGTGRDAAVLSLVDLDHFAETNDTLGHQFGDLLLQAVGLRLQARLGQHLTVARLGGDIFGVLGDAGQVNPARVLALFQTPFSIDGQDVRVTATLGLVRLADHDGSGADALKDAEIALKRAKLQQRAGHFYFTRSMGDEIRERVHMMHALRSAFSDNQLFVVYQPQIDLHSRRAVGAEALLRWQKPDGQFVSPDRFIPVAEYSGLIIELGAWVLQTACRELVRLRTLGHDQFMMSVNVSQVQFRHPQFLTMLQEALTETGAPAHCIELEITESMAMEEPDLLIKMLARIKQIGVSIAIDDFGTGFSSLSYLQRLQIDRLKIDRAFVTEITGSARGSSIAQMVIQLGHNLGLQVIAEGVEDERQAQILHALGCPLAQGFLFARPMTAGALLTWLADSRLAGVA